MAVGSGGPVHVDKGLEKRGNALAVNYGSRARGLRNVRRQRAPIERYRNVRRRIQPLRQHRHHVVLQRKSLQRVLDTLNRRGQSCCARLLTFDVLHTLHTLHTLYITKRIVHVNKKRFGTLDGVRDAPGACLHDRPHAADLGLRTQHPPRFFKHRVRFSMRCDKANKVGTELSCEVDAERTRISDCVAVRAKRRKQGRSVFRSIAQGVLGHAKTFTLTQFLRIY